jgi:hypothetical protein
VHIYLYILINKYKYFYKYTTISTLDCTYQTSGTYQHPWLYKETSMKSMTFVDNPSMSHEEGRERKVSQTSMKSISHEECRDDDKGRSSKEGTLYTYM